MIITLFLLSVSISQSFGQIIDFGTINMYDNRNTEMLMKGLENSQRRYDQNLKFISDLLSWISKLKTQTNESTFIEDLSRQEKFLNSLLAGGIDLAIYTKELIKVQNSIEQAITSYNSRVATTNKKLEEENSPENIFNKGVSKLENSDITGALLEFNRLNQITPDHWISNHYLGYCYYLQKNYNKALPYLEKSIRINPNQYSYEIKGWSEYYTKNYTQAIRDFTNQIELDPANPTAYYNRGSAKSELKDYFGAITDYEKAINIAPDFSMAYNNLGWVYFQRAEYSKALSYLDKAIESDEKNYVAYDSRAETKFMLKNYSGAIADCNKALELNHLLANSYLIRGRSNYRLGNKTKACEDWSQAGQFGSEEAYDFISKHCQ